MSNIISAVGYAMLFWWIASIIGAFMAMFDFSYDRFAEKNEFLRKLKLSLICCFPLFIAVLLINL